MFVSPEGEREGGEVVDDGNGMPIFGEVDGAEEGFAGVAGFHAEVRELFGDVDGKLGLGVFSAGGAEDSAEFPFLEAERAEEVALAAVAFDAQDSE